MTAQLRLEHPDKQVLVSFQDEARFGLKPSYRRRWAKRGKRPLASSRTQYVWTYLYASVEPCSGTVFWLLLPRVNTAVMTLFLQHYVANLSPEVLMVVVLDGAGWHRSKKLEVPANLVLVGLPPYTPELNPAEHLWPLVREATHHQEFTDLSALETALAHRCLELEAQADVISSSTRFHGYGFGTS